MRRLLQNSSVHLCCIDWTLKLLFAVSRLTFLPDNLKVWISFMYCISNTYLRLRHLLILLWEFSLIKLMKSFKSFRHSVPFIWLLCCFSYESLFEILKQLDKILLDSEECRLLVYISILSATMKSPKLFSRDFLLNLQSHNLLLSSHFLLTKN